MISTRVKFLLPLLIILGYGTISKAISSLANNDPYPIYSAIYDPFLTTWRKQWIKGDDQQCFCCEHFSFSISPYCQKARRGRTFAGERAFLGDLQGPWNMLGLLYGSLPTGVNLTNTPLGFAKINIFSDFFSEQGGLPNQNQVFSEFNDLTRPYILFDELMNIGYFSAPIHYKKIGIRLEMSFQPWEDFGLTIQAGMGEIRQTVTSLIDRGEATGFTCNIASNAFGASTQEDCPNEFCDPIPIFIPTTTLAPFYTTCDELEPVSTTTVCTTPWCQIKDLLMDRGVAHTIFEQLGLNDCNFEQTSIEDFRFIAWWRHIYSVNEGRDNCFWPAFLIIPSVELNAVAPAAKARDRERLYSLPFGNDGHFSLGFDLGLAIDFIETIEVAFRGGMSYFFSRDINNYRIPTDPMQSGIFPYATSVNVQPGLNFNFNAIVNAYHFYYNFSAWAEYVMVKHEQDKIKLIDPDPAFLPELAECNTKFMSHLINAAVSYDISPNIALGVIAQFPIGQRNAYRSTTWMGTFRIVF